MVSHYHAFLMRIWHSDLSQGQWFFSLEDPKSHQITYFKTKEELFSFICIILNDQGKQYPTRTGETPT